MVASFRPHSSSAHCLVSSPLVVLCDANARVGSVASLAVGDQAADWEDTAGAEFHTSASNVARPAQRPSQAFRNLVLTRWHRIDFVAVPRDWFTGVKRAEVETAVALPGHAMPIVHERSRSVDASRAALRRPTLCPGGLEARCPSGASCATGRLDGRGSVAGGPLPAVARGRTKRFLPRACPKTLFSQWRQAVRPDGEQGRQGLQAQSADCVVPVRHG